MKETNQGMVIPFGLSAGRMRRSAQEYRRRGQVLDALALVRRAAEQEDSAAGWQALAAELRQLGCWEAAAILLGRVLSREDHAPSAWLDMARCQAALGAKGLAVDCLYHQLQEDPWSPEGDVARAMLGEVEDVHDAREPRRTNRLIQRGLQLWRRGDSEAGMRCLKRAVCMSAHKERLMTTIALLCMAQWDFKQALVWLAKAMRADPQEPRVICTMAAVLQQMGKRRMARGFLHQAMPLCMETPLEEQFLTSAWAMDAWPEMEQYLAARLKQHPYRTLLLRAKATMLYERGERQAAQETWRHILSIDPGDRRAAALLAWSKEHPGDMLPPPGKLPLPILAEQHRLVRNGDSAAGSMFRFGGEGRRLLDWFVASGEAEEEGVALTLAQTQPDRETETRFLRELLTRPDVTESARQKALMRLAEMKHFEPLTMLLGDRYTTAQCQPVSEQKARRPWRMFLPLLLRETRQYDESMEIAHFAAALWPCMTREQQLDAATSGGFLWCRAFEVLWLRHTGREDEAVRVVRQMPVSARRVSRLLRQLAKGLE